MSEKISFGCLDFRNAKYQGFTKGKDIDGLGIVLDIDYMFSLSHWKKDVPNGSTLIVFPNRDYLYGTIINKKLSDLCVYVLSSGQKMILNCKDGDPQFMAYIEKNETNVIELTKEEKGFKIVSFMSYQKSPQEKQKIFSQILHTELPAEYENYKTFVKSAFKAESKEIVEIAQHSGSTFIGFKQTNSLGIQFDKNHKVKALGNYETTPFGLQFGRRYLEPSNKQTKIEQGRFNLPMNFKTYSSNANRPSEALRLTEDYFKIGTNFKNQFLNFNFFISLSLYFQDLKNQIETNIFEYGGQIILGKDLKENSTKEKYNIKQLKVQIQKINNRKYREKRTQRQSPLTIRNGGQIMTRSPIRQAKKQDSSERYNQPYKYSPEKKYNPINEQAQNKQFSPLKKRLQKRYMPDQNYKMNLSPYRGMSYKEEGGGSRQDQYRGKYDPQEKANSNKSMGSIYRNSMYKEEQASPYEKIKEFHVSKSPYEFPRQNLYNNKAEKYNRVPYNNNNNSSKHEEIAYNREISPLNPVNSTFINMLSQHQNESQDNQFEHYQRYKNKNRQIEDVQLQQRYRKTYKYI